MNNIFYSKYFCMIILAIKQKNQKLKQNYNLIRINQNYYMIITIKMLLNMKNKNIILRKYLINNKSKKRDFVILKNNNW